VVNGFSWTRKRELVMQDLVQVIRVFLDWSKSVPGSRGRIIFATVCGLLAGLGGTVLIAVINSLLNGGPIKAGIVWAFALLCVGVPVLGFISQTLLARLTAEAGRHMRMNLSRQILAAPYRILEEVGHHRLHAIITEDIPAVTLAIGNLSVMGTQFAILAACLVYLGFLSWQMLAAVLAYMSVGVLTHQLPMRRSVQYLKLMRVEWDKVFKAFHGLTGGSKELKLNRARRKAFYYEHLAPPVDRVRHYGVKANTLSIAAATFGQILYFIFIGLTIFLLPLVLTSDRRILTGYALTILFMISPLNLIVNMLPNFGRALVGANQVRSLGLSLTREAPDEVDVASGELPEGRPDIDREGPSLSWNRLELVGASHVYRHESSDEEFYLGPVDLTFVPGEVVFLIGGNGSGKTTLAKLLLGLYATVKGEIRLDGKVITRAGQDDYRQYFSVVFYDFFLFEHLLGVPDHDLEQRAETYLARLQLSRKVRLRDGRLTTVELSQGQRKRLALLIAYLEDRPMYIFDEWASDQDPMFKDVFYYEIVPELKARGKTVIVISHDDRYYHLADRTIKLEQGQLEYDRRNTAPQPSGAAGPSLS
jgi:putative ATP-binding cassette transporter